LEIDGVEVLRSIIYLYFEIRCVCHNTLVNIVAKENHAQWYVNIIGIARLSSCIVHPQGFSSYIYLSGALSAYPALKRHNQVL